VYLVCRDGSLWSEWNVTRCMVCVSRPSVCTPVHACTLCSKSHCVVGPCHWPGQKQSIYNKALLDATNFHLPWYLINFWPVAT
jgi:hypothetical protein